MQLDDLFGDLFQQFQIPRVRGESDSAYRDRVQSIQSAMSFVNKAKDEKKEGAAK